MANARIAVLFDAENIAPDFAKVVLGRLETRGSVSIKVAVGDFTNHPSWIGIAVQLGINTVMQPCLGKGKNASDIALTIQALDILRDHSVDTFAIVSSDRDFTPLALYLVRSGVKVFGYGKTVADHNPFAAACTDYEPLPAAKPILTQLQPTVEPRSNVPKLSRSEIALLESIRTDKVGSENGHPNWWSAFGVELLKADPELHVKVGGGKSLKKTMLAIWASQPA